MGSNLPLLCGREDSYFEFSVQFVNFSMQFIDISANMGQEVLGFSES